MKAFSEIFKLEFLGFVRSRALALLTVVSIVWMLIAPHVFRADGTGEGAREMCVRFSLGGVTALLAIALLVSATGALARERAARRLQLTMVRPVRPFVIVLGKALALSAIGALVLALAATVEFVRQDSARTCCSVRHPVLPSPAAEAEEMYATYMADPETPPAVKKAGKRAVIRLLTQRALDHYQTIGTNETVTWKFNCGETEERNLSVRFRFTNMYEMRDEVRGTLRLGGVGACVSNITQAIVRIPLSVTDAERGTERESDVLSFRNEGFRAVMLRPRKDIELLVESDGFAANLVRAWLQLAGMLTLLVFFGVFLGAGLSRPVALFVALVTLALSEMTPSVIEQYPEELETDRLDAIGLTLARMTAAATHPVSSLRPLAALAADERIEPREVLRTLLVNAALIPLVLIFLSSLILPRTD